MIKEGVALAEGPVRVSAPTGGSHTSVTPFQSELTPSSDFRHTCTWCTDVHASKTFTQKTK